MKPEGCVLLVSGGEGTHLELRKVLNGADVDVRQVGSCAEVQNTLEQLRIPAIVFSETALPDGTWMDVLTLATRAPQSVPVIIVSRLVDIHLYITALEKGASDFVVPPFYHQDISHVLKCATRTEAAIQRAAAA